MYPANPMNRNPIIVPAMITVARSPCFEDILLLAEIALVVPVIESAHPVYTPDVSLHVGVVPVVSVIMSDLVSDSMLFPNATISPRTTNAKTTVTSPQILPDICPFLFFICFFPSKSFFLRIIFYPINVLFLYLFL